MTYPQILLNNTTSVAPNLVTSQQIVGHCCPLMISNPTGDGSSGLRINTTATIKIQVQQLQLKHVLDGTTQLVNYLVLLMEQQEIQLEYFCHQLISITIILKILFNIRNIH